MKSEDVRWGVGRWVSSAVTPTTTASFLSLCSVHLSSLYCLFMCFLGCYCSFSHRNTPSSMLLPSISSSSLSTSSPHTHTYPLFCLPPLLSLLESNNSKNVYSYTIMSSSTPAWTYSFYFSFFFFLLKVEIFEGIKHG